MKNGTIHRFGEWGGGFAVAVVVLHVIAFGLFAYSLHGQAVLLAMGFLAYTLGLRHAFDPDHIAAIDTTVRSMIQEKKRPQGVGFFFSLGHSTVVLLLSLGIAAGSAWIVTSIPGWQTIGDVIGPSVSGVFLLLMGTVNLLLWFKIFKVFKKLRNSPNTDAQETAEIPGGLLMRLFRPLFGFVRKSWHLYPVGFLFGLGFDTASEIALLSLSAQGAAQSLSFTAILSLPLLFASGMSIMDTADGVFMSHAYRWAAQLPAKKSLYNLCMTGISVLLAVVIGAVELLQVVLPSLGWNEGVAEWVENIDFGNLGFVLVGLFIVLWIVFFLSWKRSSRTSDAATD